MLNKLIIAFVVIAVIGGAWKLQAIKIEVLSRENGELETKQADLMYALTESEEESKSANRRIAHLSELFIESEKEKKIQKDRALFVIEKFNKEKSNDKDCEKWSNTSLPSCVVDILLGIKSKAGNGIQVQDSTSPSSVSGKNPTP